MNSFEKKLITLVKENDLIYNTESRDYKNISKRGLAWVQISGELKTPIKECKQRWKSLRDRFVREKKKMDQPFEIGADEFEMWQLYPLLEFLADSVKPRKHVQISKHEPSSFLDESSGTHQDVLSPKPEGYISPGIAQTPPYTNRNEKRSRLGDFPINEFFGNLSQTFSQRFNKEEPDDNDLFMRMIAKKMKILPQQAKIRLQGRILEEVNEEMLKFLEQ